MHVFAHIDYPEQINKAKELKTKATKALISMMEELSHFDVVISASVPSTAWPVNDYAPKGKDGYWSHSLLYPLNWSGHAALSVPIGMVCWSDFCPLTDR